MKKVFLAAAALLALSVPASAADLPVEVPAAVAVSAYNWTGFYVGVNAGYARREGDASLTSVDGFAGFPGGLPPNIATGIPLGNSGGFIGGVQLGYNIQFGNIVVGIEADLNYLDADGSGTVTHPGDPVLMLFPSQTTGRSETDWLSTIRGRVGLAFDRFLVYGTGGFAIGRVENSVTALYFPSGALGVGAPNFGSGTSSSTEVGWTVGAGVEFALGSGLIGATNASVKIEYLYYDLGDRSVTALFPDFPGSQQTYRFENTGHIVRAGLNLRF